MNNWKKHFFEMKGYALFLAVVLVALFAEPMSAQWGRTRVPTSEPSIERGGGFPVNPDPLPVLVEPVAQIPVPPINQMSQQCNSGPSVLYFDLSVVEKSQGNYFIVGNMPAVPSNIAYNFIIAIRDAPVNGAQVSINFGNGQIEQFNTAGASLPAIYNRTIYYGDLSSKTISVYGQAQTTTNTNIPCQSWTHILERYNPSRSVGASNYVSPDEVVTVGGINMCIKYAPSNYQRKLNKPILFVEGIDFGKQVICEYTGKTVRIGSFGWDTFITGLVEDSQDEDNETFALLPTFANDMLGLGYDLVFCDFINGTAAIEDNGNSFMAVIREVNRRKQANLNAKQFCYSNSVVGASMGGQVARWALKTMENSGIDHDCSLYFSLDSPHKGANIPLALQAFIQFNATHGPENSNKIRMRDFWNGLNAPAPKQLLALHLASNHENRDYLDMMKRLDYPQRTRNVASANGSGYGGNQGYSNEATLAALKATTSIKGVDVKVFDMTLSSSNSNTIAKLFRVLEEPQERNYLSILNGHMALEKLSNRSVVLKESEIMRSIFNLGIVPIATEWGSRTIYFDKDISQWDNASGGNRNDIGGSFMKSIGGGLRDNGLDIPIEQFPLGKQCFIPTVSALDLATDDLYTNATDFVGGDLSHPNSSRTPFKSIYISGSNEAHVFMSPGLLNFAKGEITASTKVSCRPMTADPTRELSPNGSN